MYSATRCYYYTIAILVYCILNHPTGYFLPVDPMLCSIFRPASDRRNLPMAEAVRNEMQCNLVYARGAWRRPVPCARAFSPCITLRTWQKRRQFRLPLGTCKCNWWTWNKREGANAKYYSCETAHLEAGRDGLKSQCCYWLPRAAPGEIRALTPL